MDWRLILDSPRDGAWNMALDEALWRSALAGAAPPTLRLYAWAPATVSLGRFQDTVAVDHAERGRRGIGLVRRPTGGRAVLHDRELTYSVTASERALGATASTVGVIQVRCSRSGRRTCRLHWKATVGLTSEAHFVDSWGSRRPSV